MNRKHYTKGQIQNAINNSQSITDASRYLNCSYNTFKSYAKMYELFDENKNQSGKGILKDGTKRTKPNFSDAFGIQLRNLLLDTLELKKNHDTFI